MSNVSREGAAGSGIPAPGCSSNLKKSLEGVTLTEEQVTSLQNTDQASEEWLVALRSCNRQLAAGSAAAPRQEFETKGR
jgi:hypothetical protein